METGRGCLMLLLHANNKTEVARMDEEIALKASFTARCCGWSPRDSIPIASAKLNEHVPQSVEGSVSETVKYGRPAAAVRIPSCLQYNIIGENSP